MSAPEESSVDPEDLDIDEEKAQRLWSKIADDPELASKLLRAVEGMVPDILKRSVFASVGNVLLSEEGLRAMLTEKNIPKEVVHVVMAQADVMRREILRIISREIRIFLENMDFGGEVAKILTTLSFEIKTEIRFIPNDQAVKPTVKNRVHVKRAQDKPGASSAQGLDPEDREDEPGQASRGKTSPLGSGKPPGVEVPKKRRWALRRRDEETDDEPASPARPSRRPEE